jgi:hypothetical protein
MLTGTTIRIGKPIFAVRETSSSMSHGRSQHIGVSTTASFLPIFFVDQFGVRWIQADSFAAA